MLVLLAGLCKRCPVLSPDKGSVSTLTMVSGQSGLPLDWGSSPPGAASFPSVYVTKMSVSWYTIVDSDCPGIEVLVLKCMEFFFKLSEWLKCSWCLFSSGSSGSCWCTIVFALQNSGLHGEQHGVQRRGGSSAHRDPVWERRHRSRHLAHGMMKSTSVTNVTLFWLCLNLRDCSVNPPFLCTSAFPGHTERRPGGHP